MSEGVRTFVIRDGSGYVFVVNQGPKGDKGDDGDSGDVTGPLSSVDGNIATFNGTSGNAIKDSGVQVSSLATTAALTTGLDGKVDKVTGYDLSQEDFTTAEKDKLAALSEGTFRGTFDDEATLVAGVPLGDANEGDYAYVVDPVPGAEQILYHWDVVNGVWVSTAPGSVPRDATEILAALETDTGIDYNTLTDARLDALNHAVSDATFNSVIATLTGGAAPTTNVVVDATTARTLTTTDVGKFICLTNGSPCTITIPDDATALWTLFPPITFYVKNAVPVFAPDPGVTLNDASGIEAALVTGSTVSLKKIGADEWVLVVGM